MGRPGRLFRALVGGAALAWGAPVVVASCSTSEHANPVPVDAAAEVQPVADASVGVDAATDSANPTGCPWPDVKARCDGADPGLVFFPPVGCDPKDADGGGAAGDGGDAGPCANVSSTDVSVTPDACRAFAGAETAGRISFGDATRAPAFVEPADGAALTPDEWSIFAWNKGPQARRGVAGWLEGSAWALSPLNGDGYVIVFTQGCTEILRAMTAATFWAPDPVSWNTLASTQGPVTVRVYWAKFVSDGIAAGPVGSSAITITMTH
jgi:hypothetical protein